MKSLLVPIVNQQDFLRNVLTDGSRRIMAMSHYLLGRPWGVGLGHFKK